METVTNVANAATEAAKAAWGANEATTTTPHQEPISGVKGDVSKGEPYDAGNLDEATQQRLSETQDRPMENVPLKSSEGVTKQSEGITQEPEFAPQTTEREREMPSQRPTEAAHTQSRAPESFPESSQPKSSMPKSSVPGSSAPESSVHESSAVPESSVHEPSSSSSSAPTGPSPSNAAKAAMKETETESAEEGTGEQYVKTTGFAADGGDFDATKPGAGREADRLLEEKGIHHDDGGQHGGSPSASHGEGKSKRSLGERIKSKLHVHGSKPDN